jgi:outer membrane lipoprotein-sorting protein
MAWVLGLVLWGTGAGRCGAVEAHAAVVGSWLAAATNLVTWQAAFTQTRQLAALKQPLVSTGQVWFAAPDSFRWELGGAGQSIAMRSGTDLMVLSPRFKRAERYRLEPGAPGPMQDALALLDTGFPRSQQDFARRFEVLGVETNGPVVVLRLRPRNPGARRMMPAMAVELDPAGWLLRGTELTFADGSRMRNAFTSVITNGPVSAELFRTNLDSSWKTTEPR